MATNGIFDGQPVDRANTNPAFMTKNGGDDTTTTDMNFQSVTPAAGANVNQVQGEMNGQNKYTGRPSNSGKDSLPAWLYNYVGTTLDNLHERADFLTRKFAGLIANGGHKHNGTDGEGAAIDAVDLVNVRLSGKVLQGVDQIGVTGVSTNVSTDMSGKTPSSGIAVKGVVVTAPYNKVIIRQATGASTDDVYRDGSGNIVYGRITESAGVWTLSYYVEIAAVETAYSFASPSDVRWYFQELFNPVTDAPVYSEFAVIPSENTTSDVVDATETQAGKVLLSNIVATSVGSANVKGTSARVSHEDHAHQGVHSISKSGSADLFGDVDLVEGSDISITQVDQNITIAGTVKRRAGLATISNGATSVVVTYSTPLTSALPPTVTMVNVTDANPQFQTAVVTAYDDNGFTASWNNAADSANYKLSYFATVST